MLALPENFSPAADAGEDNSFRHPDATLRAGLEEEDAPYVHIQPSLSHRGSLASPSGGYGATEFITQTAISQLNLGCNLASFCQ